LSPSLARIVAITLNTYREAVRARVLLGVFALGLGTGAYSLVVATLSLHNEARVVADLGAAGLSLYGVLVAIVVGSTSLHRELEYKTVFPILSRPIRRWEYLLGKYLGTVTTVAVFIVVDTAVVFAMLALEGGQSVSNVLGTVAGLLAVLGVVVLRAKHTRVFAVIPWAPVLAAATWLLAWPEPEERRLVLASSLLALCEIAIVAAVATLFSSFSSPFLTATCTALVFILGRSADTLAHLPPRMFGAFASVFHAMARVVPNLHVYVPARTLLLGQAPGHPLWPYVGEAALHAVFYATVLVAVGTLAFRKRDFS
jgi:ABC-type transport system involved in multi-copper enzyme maturation permease subunit